jgi:hypothetical protein
MTTTATITQLRVPQTLTASSKPTKSAEFDALLEMVTSAIASDASSGDAADMTETAAHYALWTFADDGVTNDYVVVREFAMALATMMSTERLPLEDSIEVAHFVNELSMQNDLPAFMDWSARERHARHTASLMFALIHKRQQMDGLPQNTADADARN